MSSRVTFLLTAVCFHWYGGGTDAFLIVAPRPVGLSSVVCHRTSSCLPAAAAAAALANHHHHPQYQHSLAILAMPYTSLDRIANEAILETVLPTTNKLSVVLKCEGKTPSVATLRRYVGEIYSQLWDCAMDRVDPEQLDVVVYPTNLPNSAPESWITIQPDLDCLCSHDSFLGWTSEAARGRGQQFQTTEGVGGLDAHVAATNLERKQRKLRPVTALHVNAKWPRQDRNVIFLDDEENEICNPIEYEEDENVFMGGPPIRSRLLFESVAVGGTFDGLHFGHRKLLTLAVSSVQPLTGRLLVGVTADEMLQHKEYAELIPSVERRIRGVERFLHRLAPGMMNRVKIVPIYDSFGPPGKQAFFDALVLSHETLETGFSLNKHRQALGMEPLHLLCTRRTEAHGMSSTALRRIRSQHQTKLV